MLLPLFLNLAGRRVLLVGGGPVAAAKLRQLLASAANIHVVSPEVVDDIERAGASSAVTISRREFTASDLDDAWLVVAAATPEVNRQVAEAAEAAMNAPPMNTIAAKTSTPTRICWVCGSSGGTAGS